MVQPHTVRLRWEGAKTAQAIDETLRSGDDVEVELPADFHHALFEHVYPDAQPGALEDVDVSGGAELLERIAGLRGLAALADAAAAVIATAAEVYVQSPAPKIIIRHPARASAS